MSVKKAPQGDCRTVVGPYNFKKQQKISTVEIALILTLLILGSVIVVMTPVGAGYDEDQHLIRVWQLSALQLVPREKPARESRFPEIYFDLSYRKQPLVESVGFDYWEKYGKEKLYDRGFYYGPVNTRSNYSPPLLFPQAVVMRYLGRKEDLPALPVYFATRLAGLLTYTILAWLAVRWIPYGKWIMLALATAPMAIYQASTISADTITNGIGLLFIGGCLAIQEKERLDWKEWGELVLLVFVLFFTKPNLFPLVLLPFLSIAPSKFSKKAAYPALIIAVLILFVIEFVGWNVVSPNAGFVASNHGNTAEQLKYIISHPLSFPRVILNDLIAQGPTYLMEWIGVYGYEYGIVPFSTYIFFASGLILALLSGTENRRPDNKVRIILASLFIVCFIVTEAALYVTWTAVGEKFTYGVQGRYLIPIFPLLFLALYGLPLFRKFKISILFVEMFSLAASVVFVLGLILSYHVTCGSSYYNPGLCYQPFYKNFSPMLRSSPPISKDVTLIQEFVPVCDGMSRVEVRINSNGQDKNGRIELILRDAKQNASIIQKTVQNIELPEDAWYSMDFNPDWESAGKLFTLTMRGLDSRMGQGPLLAYSVRPEYPLGNLYINGNAVEDDVIFRYSCIAGLEKMLWSTDGSSLSK